MKISIALLCGMMTAAAIAAPNPGDIIWKENNGFKDYSRLKNKVVKDGVLTITAGQGVAAEKDAGVLERDVFGRDAKVKKQTNYTISRGMMEILKSYAGYLVAVEADVKGDCPIPKVPWNGIRFSLNFATDTVPFSYSLNALSGKYDWKKVSFDVRIPLDLRNVSITMGILGTEGTASFRNVKIRIKDLPRSAGFGKIKTPMYKGHDLERLRGFNTVGLRYDNLKNIKTTWKANLVTQHFRPSRNILKGKELEDFLEKNAYPLFDKAEEYAASQGIYYIIQMLDVFMNTEHPLSSDLFYTDPSYADYFVDIWSRIAKRYKGKKYIYGFQLLNESMIRVPKQPACPDYEELMERAALAINRIDPERTIIVQPEQWYSIRAFDRMRPIKAKNVVYAPHVYSPFEFTHQGLNGKKIRYPGKIGGKYWNKELLRINLEPARQFQLQYNVHMIVTEFAAISCADPEDRAQWTKDTIELFEEYGWDWTWHAFADWHGWRPNWIPSPDYTMKNIMNAKSWMESKEDTPTAKVLKSFMAGNQFLPTTPLKNPSKETKTVRKTAPVPVLDYPVEKVRAGGYVTGKGLTFIPGERTIRASWLKKDEPTTFLTYPVPLKASEWTPSFAEYQVEGTGTVRTVFKTNPIRKKQTWICLKDLNAFVNGKKIECYFGMTSGVKCQLKEGKSIYVTSQISHIWISIPVKNGDKIRIEWSARPALPENVADMGVDPAKLHYTAPKFQKPFPKAKNEYRVLFKGNSITRHSVNKKLKWDRDCGMAASELSKDYVHQFAAMLQKAMPDKKVTVAYGSQNSSTIQKDRLQQADLVVIQNAEHFIVSVPKFNEYPSMMRGCLDRIRKFPGSPRIIIIGIWCPGKDEYKNYVRKMEDVQRKLAEEYKTGFVSVEKYAVDPACSGDGEDDGVKWHPNDKGMEGYAKELFKVWSAFQKSTK